MEEVMMMICWGDRHEQSSVALLGTAVSEMMSIMMRDQLLTLTRNSL